MAIEGYFEELGFSLLLPLLYPTISSNGCNYKIELHTTPELFFAHILWAKGFRNLQIHYYSILPHFEER